MSLTERSWTFDSNRAPLLTSLLPRLTHRKIALLACAFCREVWHLLVDERCRKAVEACERGADGTVAPKEYVRLASGIQIAEGELRAARAIFSNRRVGALQGGQRQQARLKSAYFHAARTVRMGAGSTLYWLQYGRGKYKEVSPVLRAAESAVATLKRAAQAEGQDPGVVMYRQRSAQCDLLRDLIGHLFRPVPPIDPPWLRWHDGCVRRIATGIYDGNRWDDLPILGDALEDAGCADREILAHCRSGGVHRRGCWLVDALLGKET